MSHGSRPRETVLLACPVLKDLVEPRLGDTGIAQIYMDYGLHVQPKRMAPALQERLEALSEPRTILVGYGLCGMGLAGLEAGRHTLIIPRTHDCIAILLGSHEAYLQAQNERPGTYYLTRGWIETDNHPLGQYRSFLERFDEESAGHVIDAMYASYTSLFYVAATQEDLDELRPRVQEVADFCRDRWGMTYGEKVGSPELLEKLLAVPIQKSPLGDDFLVIPPGGRVEAEMFLDA